MHVGKHGLFAAADRHHDLLGRLSISLRHCDTPSRPGATSGMLSDVKRLKDGVCRSPIPPHRIVLLKANV